MRLCFFVRLIQFYARSVQIIVNYNNPKYISAMKLVFVKKKRSRFKKENGRIHREEGT